MVYQLDYDLHLIRKRLKKDGVRDYDPAAIPIPANAPDTFRVYFVTPGGEIPVGFNPTPREMLTIKTLAYACRDEGDSYVFVLQHAYILEVLKLNSWGLIYALSLFSKRNVLQPLLQQVVEGLVSTWRTENQAITGTEQLVNASDEDILAYLYKDKS